MKKRGLHFAITMLMVLLPSFHSANARPTVRQPKAHSLAIPVLIFNCASVLQSNTQTADQGSDPDVDTDAYREILALIQKGRLSVARATLKKHLADNVHDHKVILLRKALANAYRQNGIVIESQSQFNEIIEYVLAYPIESRPILQHVPQVLMNLAYIQQATEPRNSEVLGKMITVMSAAVYDHPENVAYSRGLSMASGLLARSRIQQLQIEDGIRIYTDEILRLEKRWRENLENPEDWLRLIYFLKSAEETVAATNQAIVENWTFVRMNLLETGIDQFHQSTKFVEEYFATRLKAVTEYEDLNTNQAFSIYDVLRKKINWIIAQREIKKTLIPLKLQIEKKAQFHQRVSARRNMSGKPVPRLQGNVRWLNRSNEFSINASKPRPNTICFFNWGKKSFKSNLLELHQATQSNPGFRPLVITNGADRSLVALETIIQSQPNTDNTKAIHDEINAMLDELSISFPVGIALDLTYISKNYGITTVPCAVTIDENSKCDNIFLGSDYLKTLLQTLK